MPRYKFTYAVETPVRAQQDATFTRGEFSVTLGFSRPLDPERIPAYTIVEGTNWKKANDIAMEDAFGPVLDALSLYLKAPAMLQNIQSVVKAETGITRKAVLIESHTEFYPVNLNDLAVQEVQNALDGDRLNRPVFRWLRYSYRCIPVLERFVFAWLAFENFCGVKNVVRQCPHCQKDLPAFPSTDREKALQVMQSREPQLTKEKFETEYKGWWHDLRNPVLHGGRRSNSDMRQRMQAAIERFRPAIEDIMQQEVGYSLAYPGTRSNDGVFQINFHHFVEFSCAPDTGEFAETPSVPSFNDRTREPQVDDSVTLLNFDEAKDW